jgi:hypothetical protein
MGNYAAITVPANRPARHVSIGDEAIEMTTGSMARAPGPAIALAILGEFRCVDPLETDADAGDGKRVTVDDARRTRDGLWRRGHRHGHGS